ncbi:MAG TPA: NADH-quinone oxidoreductase subunit L, partial [Armatimonadota bacterium]|nr:NADH-quinone oxidoreductase subunit L [Armatimonadota bacterium]
PALEAALQLLSTVAVLGGIALAYQLYLRRREATARWLARPAPDAARRLLLAGWGFDWLYDRLFVRPFVWLATVNKDDSVDAFFRGLARASLLLHGALSRAQTGNLRWYAVGFALGVMALLAIVVFR